MLSEDIKTSAENRVSTTESVDCNLCGSAESRVRYCSDGASPADEAAHFAATTDRYGDYGTVRECLGCGLVYTSPRLKAQDIHRGYVEVEDRDYSAESDSRCMNAYLGLARIRKHVPGGSLLEIGCSTGFFLNAARTTYEVVGVEPSRWAARCARKRLGLEIAAPTMEEARFPAAHFDAVALIDVIEHVADPSALISEISRVLKPKGVLYLVTPDIGSFSARLLRGKWWGLRPAHLFYFSRRTLRAMLEKAGFEVVSMRSYGRIFTWGYWLSRLVNYPRPITLAVRAFIRILRIEDKFLYLDTRDSVQLIARKRA
ncbi:MAG: class I SAM-dependent methyltransferase [Elusimicrobiota bacterium]